ASESPLRAVVRRPAARSGDVIALLPRPPLVRPPLPSFVSTSLDERQVGRVRDRGAADQIGAHIGAVAGALVVVCEAVRRSADRALAARDLDQLQSGGTWLYGLRHGLPAGKFVIGQARQLQRLKH